MDTLIIYGYFANVAKGAIFIWNLGKARDPIGKEHEQKKTMRKIKQKGNNHKKRANINIWKTLNNLSGNLPKSNVHPDQILVTIKSHVLLWKMS